MYFHFLKDSFNILLLIILLIINSYLDYLKFNNTLYKIFKLKMHKIAYTKCKTKKERKGIKQL